ncbi:hypothetical protein EV181_000283 [Coemansia sp. RSA 532]|nr:hypothetical protein EV181_000283 [Coemansia sp. RSA 532]
MSTEQTKNHRYVHALNELDDVNISRIRPLIPPQILMEDLPLTESAAAAILKGRQEAEAIIRGDDDRLLVIVGPCSIHNPAAALEYADNLREYAETAAEDLCIIMRVYFEKPRTTESQVHRELASGMSVPIGFKNGTDGNAKIAVDAIKSSESPHCFLSVTKQGLSAIVETQGNKYCHVILRGGADGPNYEESYVAKYTEQLAKAGVNPRLMIDCSHGNSSKDFRKQPIVAESIAHQLSATETGKYITGVMIESNLVEGNQSIPKDGDLSKLVYGQSITDACVNWDDTVTMLDGLCEACDKASDFETKFRTLLTKLDVVEGEETWQQIDGALKNLISLVKADVTKYDTFVPTMKQCAKFVNASVLSERTRLSATALSLVEELARQMETRFQPLADLLFPSVMKTCGRANKVFVTRGVNCLTTVITYAHIPDQIPQICYAAHSDPSKTVRGSATKLLMSIVSCCTVPELTPHLAAVEKAIASGVVDANPDARTTTRQTYEIFIKRFSNRVEQFHAGLSSTAKKYLKLDDKSAGAGRPQSQSAASRQRLPLRDRILAQRANAKGADAANGGQPKSGDGAVAAAPGPQRPRPMRPMTRPGPTAVRRDGSCAVVAAVPLTINDAAAAGTSPTTPNATDAIPEPPAMPAKSNTLENVLMSPRSSKPTLTQLFGEDTSTTPVSTDTEKPKDSAQASATPSCAPSPTEPKADSAVESAGEGKPCESSTTATPAGSGDEAPVRGESKAVGAVRAKRGPGLSFSSLNTATSGRQARTAQAVRPQSRNIVSSRMEEALRTRPARAQRPSSSASELPNRMTLRSDSRAGSSRSRSVSSGPGYLRATASSAKRVAGKCDDAGA